MKPTDTMDESLKSVLVGDTVTVFMGTGVRLHGEVVHVGDDYLCIRKKGYPKTRVRFKAVVSWAEGNVENQNDL